MVAGKRARPGVARSCLASAGLAFVLTGCMETAGSGGGADGALAGPTEPPAGPAEGAATVSPELEPAPEVFDAKGLTLWDGSRTLQGIWVAHPLATATMRVRITNPETGLSVDGALFRRDATLAGPSVLISSEAAELLRLDPGVPTEITLVAVRPAPGGETVVAEADPAPAEPASETETETAAAEAAPAPDPAAGGGAVSDPAPLPAAEPEETGQADPAPATEPDAPAPEFVFEPAPDPTPSADDAAVAETPEAPDADVGFTLEEAPELASLPAPEPAPEPAPAETPELSDPPETVVSDTAPPVPAAEAPEVATAPEPTFTLPPEPPGGEFAAAEPEAAPAAEIPAPQRTFTLPEAPDLGPEEPAAPAPGAPQRAYIQAGTFGVAENAARLVERLQGEGLTARAIADSVGGRAVSRVVVGPFDTTESRDAALAKVRRMGLPDALPVRG